jgi:hypothetical protein
MKAITINHKQDWRLRFTLQMIAVIGLLTLMLLSPIVL